MKKNFLNHVKEQNDFFTTIIANPTPIVLTKWGLSSCTRSPSLNTSENMKKIKALNVSKFNKCNFASNHSSYTLNYAETCSNKLVADHFIINFKVGGQFRRGRVEINQKFCREFRWRQKFFQKGQVNSRPNQWRIQKILVGGDLKPKPQKFGCLHQNWDWFFGRNRKFKRFFRPKLGGLQKKKNKGLNQNWD